LEKNPVGNGELTMCVPQVFQRRLVTDKRRWKLHTKYHGNPK